MSVESSFKNVDFIYDGDDSVTVNIRYPRQNHIKKVEVDIECVRSSDGIRIQYDFDRDGWIIEQPKRINGNDQRWTEVSFVQSWQIEEPECDNCGDYMDDCECGNFVERE